MKLSRRQFTSLTTAAFAGMVAGIANVRSALANEDEDKGASNSLLLEGPNVCRGLNQCANHKAGDNQCAGQGSCHTIKEPHVCHGNNDCKGRGGCHKNPGENACKGKGMGPVPLRPKAWQKARANFEKAMKAAGRKFGAAPPWEE